MTEAAGRDEEVLENLDTARPSAQNQIEFVNLVINQLTEHGVMQATSLYKSPTDLTPRGPAGLFEIRRGRNRE